MKLIFAVLAATIATTPAFAHATFEQKQVTPDATAKFTLRVPHGCEGEATLRVRVQIPEGLIAVKPMPKAEWKLSTVIGAYATSYELWHNTVTEGVQEIVWEGELPDAYYDEFVFRGYVSDAFKEGELLYIPVVQECATGAERWIEIPAEGQDAHDLEGPAPGVTIGAPAHGHQ